MLTRQPLAEASLTARERERLAALPARARGQWLVSRRALRLLLGLLGLPPDTGAYAFPHRRLSLSHGEGTAVAAGAVPRSAATAHRLRGLGVDFEADRPARVDTARFFLDERERSYLAALPEAARAGERLRLWTVKEALFKADPHNRRTVLHDYRTADPAARSGRARTPHDTRHDTVFGYTSARIPGGRLTVAAALAAPRPREPESENPVPALTFDDVADRVGSTLSVPAERLTPQTTLRELAADSFLLVEMAIDLQEEFGTVFTQHELRGVSTLGELAALVGVRP
ncbi:4'-phosphopantetheinyl transferase superfamily protein [Streptomyces gamaensis]|uniref:4'-phosphopantetheinyl transferase superfamily protein n=1 Tax=Streptomyces gamaensis TaxID=1763542 RepID=A0ABW0Z8H0_9ACTN